MNNHGSKGKIYKDTEQGTAGQDHKQQCLETETKRGVWQVSGATLMHMAGLNKGTWQGMKIKQEGGSVMSFGLCGRR